MSVQKLLKLIAKDNIAADLDEEQSKQIAEDIITGYEIDDKSRSAWLETNQEAMRIIKHAEYDEPQKDFPFRGASKVIYPLLAPAVIQMASRISTHIVQNDRVCTYAVLGEDQSGEKSQKATRLTNYTSAEFLINSDTWLKDTHKLCAIIASWGTAFRQVYYDPITKKACHDLLPPECVIINHNLSSLEKAKRITIKHYLTKNDIVGFINSGKFSNIDLESLESDKDQNDNNEINPSYEFLCQMLYLDLDGDGYAEPYKAYVHKESETLFGLYAAYKIKDIDFNSETGDIVKIRPRIDIVDYHCIDDPEGKFYSIGLNYLLVHSNKSITSLLRQLIDSGTLANTQGGFVTKAFKTQERRLHFEMGEFKVLECDYNVNPKDHIIPLPFKEPSQVLLALLQTLVTAGKETGFITDVLTGDIESQNTPATTMLAMVEQGTRAFKPVIQKLYISLKKEFKMWFEIQSDYLDVNDVGLKYATFQGQTIELSRADFDLNTFDVCPVADPTMSSEAHKYAKLKLLTDLFNTPVVQAINVPEALKRVFEGMQFSNSEQLLAPPQPQQPDPNMIKMQLEQQKLEMKRESDMMKSQFQMMKGEMDKLKMMLKMSEVQIKKDESDNKQRVMNATALKSIAEAKIKDRMVDVAEDKVNVERDRLALMEKQSRNKDNS